MTEQKKEYMKEYSKEYYKKNKDKLSKQGKEYQENNKDKIKKRRSEYYRENKEKILKKVKEYCKSIKGEAVVRNTSSKRRSRTKQTDITTKFLIDLKQNTSHCEICGKKLKDNIHLDHIIPLNIGGTHTRLNVRYVHAKCNLQRPKNGSDIIQFKLQL